MMCMVLGRASLCRKHDQCWPGDSPQAREGATVIYILLLLVYRMSRMKQTSLYSRSHEDKGREGWGTKQKKLKKKDDDKSMRHGSLLSS